jgi:hypothetical protein
VRARARHLLASWWSSRWRWPSIIAATITVIYLVWPAVDNTSRPVPATRVAQSWTPPPPPEQAHAEPQGQGQGWGAVAVGFAHDFTQPGPQWHERVARWTSDYLDAELAHVPQYRIPQGSGPTYAVNSSGDALADVTVTYTNGLALDVRLERVPTIGWQVTRVIPAHDSANP